MNNILILNMQATQVTSTVKNSNQTLLFADICNSTQLYERLGDQKAKERVSECLRSIETIAERCRGIIVKTIGDELMIRFASVEDATNAACQMQKETMRVELHKRLDIRVGLHSGPTIMENGDVFGDSVNTAARIVSLSKPGQILTSGETAKQLPAKLFENCRHIDRTQMKGKSEDIDLYEIFDDEEDLTQMTIGATRRNKIPTTLLMQYKNQEYIFRDKQSQFAVGRSMYCDIVLDEELASRQHITLENRRGKLFIIDLSTNGTWVKNEKGREIFLRRDEMLMPPEGEISFGKSFKENPDHVIHFQITRE
ncbi:MAG: adenylate/guanylate cyclase domain-containing protein [Gammaproteobacteria bacterium]